MTDGQVGGFSTKATEFSQVWSATIVEGLLDGEQGGLREKEVREPMVALLDSLPEQWQLFKGSESTVTFDSHLTSRRTRRSMEPHTRSMARSITCTWTGEG